MKNPYIYILTLVLALFQTGCNDEWEEELYTQMVSFKAPIGNEGVSEVYLRYNKTGEVTYKLPIILSGSRENDKDRYVKVAVDSDTLDTFNQEKYQYRKDLYFKQLPEQFFELPKESCLIPKGAHTENYPIKFKFDNLDLVERYVLPLSIQEDPSYVTNKRKGWRKALLYVKPFNNYSGNYSATSMNVYADGQTKNPLVSSVRTSWVVDEKAVFFYAGVLEEKSEDRGRYKIIMEFMEPSEDVNGIKSGTLHVYAADKSINFEMLGQPTYQLREIADATKEYLVKQYCTVNLKYKYDDITTMPGVPVRYRAEGSMTMERSRNTLIPDEDQAIQW